MEALDRAAQVLGSLAAVARASGASDNAPSMWKKRGNVPAEYCPAIERACRAKAAEVGDPSLIVTCEELQPDVDWAVLREAGAEAAAQGAA